MSLATEPLPQLRFEIIEAARILRMSGARSPDFQAPHSFCSDALCYPCCYAQHYFKQIYCNNKLRVKPLRCYLSVMVLLIKLALA
jgi:hypothetical protein